MGPDAERPQKRARDEVDEAEAEVEAEVEVAAGGGGKRARRWPRVVLRPPGATAVDPAVCGEILAAWGRVRLSAAEMAEQAEVVGRLGRIAQKWMHKGQAELFGSRRSGIGCAAGDDVDVTVTWPGYDPARPRSEALDAAFEKKLKKLCKTMHAKGFEHPKVLKNSQLDVLITCVDVKTGLAVDVSLHNAHGVANTRFFALLYAALPELAPALWALKRFGKVRKIINSAGGYFSSYCVLHMLAAVAQQQGLLPRLPPFPDGAGAVPDAHWVQVRAALGVAGDAGPPAAPPRPEVLGQLLAGFATAYHTSSAVAVSLTLSAAAQSRAKEHFEQNASGDAAVAPVYVADALNESNCARALTPKHWLVAVNELGRLIDLIRNGDAFNAWCALHQGTDPHSLCDTRPNASA